MVFSVHTCALVGLHPHPVLCEVDLATQLPAFSLVGLPSSLTQESRERIRAAVTNSDFEWPARKVTINLLPANLPKWGSHFELPMALGVLGATMDRPCVLNIFALGELSLSGELRPCGWSASIAQWILERARKVRASQSEPLLVVAHEDDVRQLLVAAPALREVAELCGARTLHEACSAMLEALAKLPRSAPRISAGDFHLAGGEVRLRAVAAPLATLSEVRNEKLGVLAALAAIAGRHHCLFAGPHGMGKSMLVRSITESLPPLTEAQSETRQALLRTFGEVFSGAEPRGRRPVVELQASASRAALEGSLLGSGQVLPGEFTRAHLGSLVADELLELRRDAIEAFRQPLDDGFIRLQRAKFRAVLPAQFQFLASTNLCPCGRFGITRKTCRCAPAARHGYQARLSGPLLDRFDLIVVVGDRCVSRLPPDLVPVVDELVDQRSWQRRLERFEGGEGQDLKSPLPVSAWAEVSTQTSDRGKLKLARVARTLARLLDEPPGSRHLRLAILIRQDLGQLLGNQVLPLRPVNKSVQNQHIINGQN